MKSPVTGKIVGKPEYDAATRALRSWMESESSGQVADEFGRVMAKYVGVKHGIPCNSGSSANLLACVAILRPGDEVITTALNFPTTLAPISQLGALPVLVDVSLDGLVPSVDSIKRAITAKTTAIILAHPLGYPFPADKIADLCCDKKLMLIEDCCDALGTRINGRMVGTFGDMATLSFYAAHHITTWEGGMVLTDNDQLARRVKSLRDWGRACWCLPGKDNTCGHRFDGGYDHKYSYSHLGYNLKMPDFCAAIGLEQIIRLSTFIAKRKNNHFEFMRTAFEVGLGRWFILPRERPNYDVSWFGVALICKEGIDRRKLQQYLNGRGIGSRPIFGGNMLRQIACAGMPHRIAEDLANTNIIHERGLWLGCWPGLGQENMSDMVWTLKEFCK